MTPPAPGRHRVPRPRRTTRGAAIERPFVLSSALRRPLVTTTAALAVLSASAAGFAHHGSPASYTVSSEAATQATEQDTASVQDAAALAKAKNDGAQRASAVAEKARLAAVAKAEKARKAAAAAKAAKIERARKAAAAAKAARAAKAAQAARQAEQRRAANARAARAQQRASIAARVSSDPRGTARVMLGNYGWSSSQFGCLDSLWMKESGWNSHATNGSSGAYGSPQSLPGSKMASAGSDWQTNPATQIKWGLQYIKDVYGSPCSAWSHSQAVNWY
jgi:membrane protein involved in colicin uptake